MQSSSISLTEATHSTVSQPCCYPVLIDQPAADTPGLGQYRSLQPLCHTAQMSSMLTYSAWSGKQHQAVQPLFVQKLQVDLYSMVWKDNVKVKNMLQKMDRKPAWKPESNIQWK